MCDAEDSNGFFFDSPVHLPIKLVGKALLVEYVEYESKETGLNATVNKGLYCNI